MTKLISEPPPRSAIVAYLVQWHRGDGHYVSMCGQNGTSMASARKFLGYCRDRYAKTPKERRQFRIQAYMPEAQP